jgi:hypothetical protein
MRFAVTSSSITASSFVIRSSLILALCGGLDLSFYPI